MENLEDIDANMANELFRKAFLNVIFLGPRGHGKSTLLGQILVTNMEIPEEDLQDAYSAFVRLNNNCTEYSWYVDLEEIERLERTTKRVTIREMSWGERLFLNFMHVPLNRNNMPIISKYFGQADTVILVVSAPDFELEDLQNEAVSEQLSLINIYGITNIIVAMNKLDVMGGLPKDIRAQRLKHITTTVTSRLKEYGDFHLSFVSISGYCDENLTTFTERHNTVSKIENQSLLQCLDNSQRVLHSRVMGFPFHRLKCYQLLFRPPLFNICDEGLVENAQGIMPGYSVVLLGTMESGEIREGSVYTLEPDGVEVNVWRIETRGIQVKDVSAGQKANIFVQTSGDVDITGLSWIGSVLSSHRTNIPQFTTLRARVDGVSSAQKVIVEGDASMMMSIHACLMDVRVEQVIEV